MVAWVTVAAVTAAAAVLETRLASVLLAVALAFAGAIVVTAVEAAELAAAAILATTPVVSLVGVVASAAKAGAALTTAGLDKALVTPVVTADDTCPAKVFDVAALVVSVTSCAMGVVPPLADVVSALAIPIITAD